MVSCAYFIGRSGSPSLISPRCHSQTWTSVLDRAAKDSPYESALIVSFDISCKYPQIRCEKQRFRRFPCFVIERQIGVEDRSDIKSDISLQPGVNSDAYFSYFELKRPAEATDGNSRAFLPVSLDKSRTYQKLKMSKTGMTFC